MTTNNHLYEQNRNLKDHYKRLLEIIRLSSSLSNTHHIDIILDSVLEKTQKICRAEASSLWMVDEKKQELYLYMSGDNNKFTKVLSSIRLKIGEGIAGWVVKNNKPELISDCHADPRFLSGIDKKTKFVSRTMICVPLVVRGCVIGAFQILNKKNDEKFDQIDLEIAVTLGYQIAIAIQNARLNRSISVDPHTNLFRKEYFFEHLRAMYDYVKIGKHSLSVFMCDIDHFKKINDTYGHQAGDKVIAHLGLIMHQAIHKLDSEDIVGRYGGEEFSAILMDHPLSKILDIAEKLRKSVEKERIVLNKKTKVSITVSIGVAHFPKHKKYLKSAEDFVSLADKALYLCKKKGRNCVAMYKAENDE